MRRFEFFMIGAVAAFVFHTLFIAEPKAKGSIRCDVDMTPNVVIVTARELEKDARMVFVTTKDGRSLWIHRDRLIVCSHD